MDRLIPLFIASSVFSADIREEKFYFMDVQSLCKTDDKQYLPVEIAVLEFTLQDGIRKLYHSFIKPPPIPTGLRYQCRSNSE